MPRLAEVAFDAVIGELGRAENLLRGVAEHLFNEAHDLLIIEVSAIELKLGEFRVVLVGDAFIAEVAADFINAVEAADEQTLQIELEGDSQVQILVQLVVMGDERTGRGAAVNRLEDRGLDFEEVMAVEEAAQGADDLGTLAEDVLDLRVDNEVGVALAVAQFGIAQTGMADDLAVHFFFLRGRKRGNGFRQHADIGREQGNLTGLGAHQRTAGLYEIAEVEEVLEELQLVAHLVDTQEELDAAGGVFNMRESKLAHDAQASHTAGEDIFLGVGFAVLLGGFEGFAGLLNGAVHIRTGRIRLNVEFL